MNDKKDNLVIAADIGGSHITSATVNIATWEILADSICREPIDSSQDATTIFNAWSNCIRATQKQTPTQVERLGIAAPGPFDYEQGISLMQNQDKYDALYNLNVAEGMKAFLGENMSFRFINDAAAFLQGEVYAAELKDEAAALGITLGTGLGSAVWRRGEKAFDAALWCAPYKDSIFEEFLVTRWFVKRFEELSGVKESGFRTILEKHSETEAFKTLLNEYCASLHDFLTFFAAKHDCKRFIIGGNIANAWDIIKVHHGNHFSEFEISTGQYAEKAAIIGAASLFKL